MEVLGQALRGARARITVAEELARVRRGATAQAWSHTRSSSKPAALQPGLCWTDAGVIPRLPPAARSAGREQIARRPREGFDDALHLRDVALAAALELELPAGAQGGVEPREQAGRDQGSSGRRRWRRPRPPALEARARGDPRPGAQPADRRRTHCWRFRNHRLRRRRRAISRPSGRRSSRRGGDVERFRSRRRGEHRRPGASGDPGPGFARWEVRSAATTV